MREERTLETRFHLAFPPLVSLLFVANLTTSGIVLLGTSFWSVTLSFLFKLLKTSPLELSFCFAYKFTLKKKKIEATEP